MENKKTSYIILEWVNLLKNNIVKYFYPFLAILVLLGLYVSNSFQTLFSIFSGWNMISIWTWIITIMLIAVFSYIWYWIFDGKEWTGTLKNFLAEMDEDTTIEEDNIINSTIQIILYVILLAFFLFMWYFVWYNIWEISWVWYNIILKILWNTWNTFQILFDGLLNLWAIFLIFITIRFLMRLHFKIAEGFKNKLKSNWEIDTWNLIYIVLSTITIFFIAIYSFKIVEIWNPSQNVNNVLQNTILNQIK